MALRDLIAAGSNRFVAALRALLLPRQEIVRALERRFPLQPHNSVSAAVDAGTLSYQAGQTMNAAGTLGGAPASQVPDPLPGQTGYRYWVVVHGRVEATGAQRSTLLPIDTLTAASAADVSAAASALAGQAFTAGRHPTFGYELEGGLSVVNTEILSVERATP